MADPTIPDVQVSLPFTFGSSGGVVTTDQLVKQMADHVYSVVGTQQSERRMRAAYGTNIMPLLFSSIDDLTEQAITQTVSDALSANAPEIQLIDVTYLISQESGSIDLQVHYALADAQGDVSTATVPVVISA